MNITFSSFSVISFLQKSFEERRKKAIAIQAATQIIRHEKKEELHLQPKQSTCVKTVFAIWELATDHLYYSLSMIEVYVTYCVLYLILGNSRKKLCYVTLVNVSDEDGNIYSMSCHDTVVSEDHQYSFSLCLAFSFMPYWSEETSDIILTGFFLSWKRLLLGFITISLICRYICAKNSDSLRLKSE